MPKIGIVSKSINCTQQFNKGNMSLYLSYVFIYKSNNFSHKSTGVLELYYTGNKRIIDDF